MLSYFNYYLPDQMIWDKTPSPLVIKVNHGDPNWIKGRVKRN